MMASFTTPSIEARTKSDWSATGVIFERPAAATLRTAAASRGRRLMMSSVEAAPVFRIVSSDAALAVDVDDVGLRRRAVADVRDVADEDDGAAGGPDREVVQSLDRRRAAVGLDGVFVRPDLGRAGRKDEVLRADGVDDVDGREPLGLQRGEVDVDLDLPLLAAVGERDRRALAPWRAACGSSCCRGRRAAARRGPVPESASWSIGTVEALYVMMSGGVVPGGICRSTVCAMAVICETAGVDVAPSAGRRP